jgi:hypothetical protein
MQIIDADAHFAGNSGITGRKVRPVDEKLSSDSE